MTAAPTLWTPRLAPWWRLPAWRDAARYMAHLKKGAGGHLLKGAGGHLVNSCDAPGLDCSTWTSGTTPSAFTADVIGVTMNTGCVQVGSVSQRSLLISGTINARVHLIQDASIPCRFLGYDCDTPVWHRWELAECPNTSASSYNGTWSGMAYELYIPNKPFFSFPFSVAPYHPPCSIDRPDSAFTFGSESGTVSNTAQTTLDNMTTTNMLAHGGYVILRPGIHDDDPEEGI